MTAEQSQNQPEEPLDPVKFAQLVTLARNIKSLVDTASIDLDLASIYYIGIRTLAYEMLWDVDTPTTAFNLIQGAVDEAHKTWLADEQNDDYEDAI